MSAYPSQFPWEHAPLHEVDNDARHSIIVDGSDHEDDIETRRRRIKNRDHIGWRYIKFGAVPIIQSAQLRGPFDDGWRNPWLRQPVLPSIEIEEYLPEHVAELTEAEDDVDFIKTEAQDQDSIWDNPATPGFPVEALVDDWLLSVPRPDAFQPVPQQFQQKDGGNKPRNEPQASQEDLDRKAWEAQMAEANKTGTRTAKTKISKPKEQAKRKAEHTWLKKLDPKRYRLDTDKETSPTPLATNRRKDKQLGSRDSSTVPRLATQASGNVPRELSNLATPAVTVVTDVAPPTVQRPTTITLVEDERSCSDLNNNQTASSAEEQPSIVEVPEMPTPICQTINSGEVSPPAMSVTSVMGFEPLKQKKPRKPKISKKAGLSHHQRMRDSPASLSNLPRVKNIASDNSGKTSPARSPGKFHFPGTITICCQPDAEILFGLSQASMLSRSAVETFMFSQQSSFDVENIQRDELTDSSPAQRFLDHYTTSYTAKTISPPAAHRSAKAPTEKIIDADVDEDPISSLSINHQHAAQRLAKPWPSTNKRAMRLMNFSDVDSPGFAIVARERDLLRRAASERTRALLQQREASPDPLSDNSQPLMSQRTQTQVNDADIFEEGHTGLTSVSKSEAEEDLMEQHDELEYGTDAHHTASTPCTYDTGVITAHPNEHFPMENLQLYAETADFEDAQLNKLQPGHSTVGELAASDESLVLEDLQKLLDFIVDPAASLAETHHTADSSGVTMAPIGSQGSHLELQQQSDVSQPEKEYDDTTSAELAHILRPPSAQESIKISSFATDTTLMQTPASQESPLATQAESSILKIYDIPSQDQMVSAPVDPNDEVCLSDYPQLMSGSPTLSYDPGLCLTLPANESQDGDNMTGHEETETQIPWRNTEGMPVSAFPGPVGQSISGGHAPIMLSLAEDVQHIMGCVSESESLTELGQAQPRQDKGCDSLDEPMLPLNFRDRIPNLRPATPEAEEPMSFRDLMTPSPQRKVPLMQISNTQHMFDAALANPWASSMKKPRFRNSLKRVSFGPLPSDDKVDEDSGSTHVETPVRLASPPPPPETHRIIMEQERFRGILKDTPDNKPVYKKLFTPSQRSPGIGAMAEAFQAFDSGPVAQNNSPFSSMPEVSTPSWNTGNRGPSTEQTWSQAGMAGDQEVVSGYNELNKPTESQLGSVIEEMGSFLEGWDVENEINKARKAGNGAQDEEPTKTPRGILV